MKIPVLVAFACASFMLIPSSIVAQAQQTGAIAPITDTTDDPPLNHLQFIGSHNSYHIAPSPKLLQLIQMFAPGQGEALDYTNPPLTEQMEKSNVRQIELDLYNDPEGGLYANPIAYRLPGDTPRQIDPVYKTPGFKIIHSPDFDVFTTVPTLRLALRELRAWSDAHPNHEPVGVLLELKVESFSSVKPIPFDEAALLALEGEIREELPANKILTPDMVRGDSPTLRDAVTTHGWPHLSQTRGKFIFALDNEDEVRDRYLALSPQKDLQGRLCFVSVPPTHPAAAWMKRNDAIEQFEDIRALVQAGFMVRTRADVDLKEPLANDHTRFEKAAASGAQWISTDAYKANPRWPGYIVAWPNGTPFRLNPVTP